jgi:hypothetical protein
MAGLRILNGVDIVGSYKVAVVDIPDLPTSIITSGTFADARIASASNWNTAYTDRNKWDGGSSGLTAATGRTSLGLGTAATTASAAYATAAQGTLATNALPKAGGTLTGGLTGTSATFTGAVFNGTPTAVTKNSSTNAFDIDLTSNTDFSLDTAGTWSLNMTNASSSVGQSGNLIIVNSAITTPATVPASTNNLLTPNGDTIAWQTDNGDISIISYYVISSTQILINYVGNFSK